MADFSPSRRGDKARFIINKGAPDARIITVSGRVKWTLENLIRAGVRGVTPIDRPAPRWSHYVFVLRRMGLLIETIREEHGGPYAGPHGRYVLRSRVVPAGAGEGA